ncbi:MAG: hypothetical protein A2Z29_08445 [Chloroflexi bacterium RBG_16_56_11]|nr:MAG: hypothetical protein A2Z29_08445 [Chloroflexi bacterium RBG_16_56_11]
MADNGTMKVRHCEGAVWRLIDGEVVVLSPVDISIHALTGCGGRVWELIMEEATVSEIIDAICDEYDVEPQRAQREITEFVNKLAAMKLVEMVPLVSGEVGR